MRFLTLTAFLAIAAPALSCEDDCYGPRSIAAHQRNVRRMQPGVPNAVSKPRSDLAWGQLNILHTTDTHGWLEGHLKEENYGADWGDFVSFTKHMKHKANELDVDLLLVDTGDLHDGAGLSDATTPDGLLTNPIFENVDYDLLTIGNHELYLSDIAYLTANTFAKVYGEKYISSNVQIFNNATGQYENIANQYRYFTTKKGLRIMAFGVLFDFTGNSNASKVIPAAEMVKQSWFLNAVNYTEPIDLFLLIGHNPVRGTSGGSTLDTIYQVIRKSRADVPIQVFGGHTHIRDFIVYDEGATGLESGRYCETLGWLSMSGIGSDSYRGCMYPEGVAHPSQKAIKVVVPSTTSSTGTATTTASSSLPPSAVPTVPPTFKHLRYFRRYIDWNRLSFAYHSVGSQSHHFDTGSGLSISANITETRTDLNLTTLYGIFTVLQTALAATVVNSSRANTPRLILINTGSVRFDLVQGPFTYDDSFIVSPFHDSFQYIPEVPYSIASQVLTILNKGSFQKRNVHGEDYQLTTKDFGFTALTGDDCHDGVVASHSQAMARRDESITRGIIPRAAELTLGYTTTDDFGTDGDDTIHSKIPYYYTPNDLQANASFPTDGSKPESVDLIFLDFIGSYILPALTTLGANYTTNDLQYYLPPSFDTNAYLPAYAKIAWQANLPNCPIS